MAGAAVLTARSCMRAGVGKVTVNSPKCNIPVLQMSVPEAIVRTGSEETIFSEAVETDEYDALGIGPGLGVSEQTAIALISQLRGTQCPVVVDADAINILANHPAWLQQLPKGLIMTPHPKELDRLADGHVLFNSTGNAGMATAGSGDVLTGIITGLLARGYKPQEACVVGVYLHGLAGDLAAVDLGEESLLASDIIRYMARAFKRLKE